MEAATPEWSRAIKIQPAEHLQSHLFIDEKKKFRPSYDRKKVKASMGALLSWEYSRIWLEERDAFIRARGKRTQVKHFSNDFSKWLEKRKPKEEFACRPQGAYKLAPRKKKPKSDSASKKAAKG